MSNKDFKLVQEEMPWITAKLANCKAVYQTHTFEQSCKLLQKQELSEVKFNSVGDEL